MSATADVPSDAIDVTDLLVEPDLERCGGWWFARVVDALLAARGLPHEVMTEARRVRAAGSSNSGRPFAVNADACWSYDWDALRAAPAWWREAGRAWSEAHGFHRRGVRETP